MKKLITKFHLSKILNICLASSCSFFALHGFSRVYEEESHKPALPTEIQTIVATLKASYLPNKELDLKTIQRYVPKLKSPELQKRTVAFIQAAQDQTSEQFIVARLRLSEFLRSTYHLKLSELAPTR